MGRSYGTPEVDEDDLAAELDALGDEIGKRDTLRFFMLVRILLYWYEVQAMRH